MFHRDTSLPLSHHPPSPSLTSGIRRRLSSVSLRIHPSSTTQWAMRRSKSLSSITESASTSIRTWWDWGWGWILSKKPTPDLEFNNNHCNQIHTPNRNHDDHNGSWRHVLSKVRSEIRKLVRSDKVGLPQTVRYNSGSYSRNFDDGCDRFRG